MELEPEEGELSSSEDEEVRDDGEEEATTTMSTSPAEWVDKEACDSVLSTLQRHLESRCELAARLLN